MVLSDSEKQELLEDAASAVRRSDFRQLEAMRRSLTPLEYIEFLTWSSGLFQGTTGQRRPLVEKLMLL